MKEKERPFGSEENPRPSPGFYVKNDGLIFEQVRTITNQIAFARSDVDLGTKPQPKIEIEGTWYRPLPESRVYWNIPGEPESYHGDDWLFEENRKYVYDYGDVKEPGAYDVITAFALATWRFEDWSSFAYLLYLGHYGAGKTTLQRILKQICRRAVGGPSISVPAIVSMMDRFDAVPMIDEAQTLNTDESGEMIAILRGAYQKGNMRIKSVPTGHGWTDKAYRAYGFFSIASHDPLEEGISQRCLPFSMSKRTRKLHKWRKPEFLTRGHVLRCYNLYYRFLNLGKEIPEEVEDQLEEIHDDRLQELALPLLAVAPPGPRQNILSYFKVLEKRKQVEIESGEEADYFRALDFFTSHTDLIRAPGRILFAAFKEQLLVIKKEEDTEYDPKWLSPRAMWKVLERLGFHHGGHTENGSSITFDKAQVDTLRPRFTDQITFSPVTVSSVRTVSPIENKLTQLTDLTDTGEKLPLDDLLTCAECGAKVKTLYGEELEDAVCAKCEIGQVHDIIWPHECPKGCGITFPDQAALDSHLTTFKHDDLPQGEAGGLTDSDYET